MGDTSGSAAYRLNWDTGAIEHADGRRWFVPRYMQRVYVALDAMRGEVITSERLAEAIWGASMVSAETVRMTVMHLRQRCGREVIETQPIYRTARGGPMRCGYVVRPAVPGGKSP